jgi:hypothetical protein
MLGNRDANNPAQVSSYLAGLVEPALTLAGWMQWNWNQPVGLKALTLRFIGAGESHGQRPCEAWMPAILELVNDFFDRVLEGSPSMRDIKAIQASAASPAERCFSGDCLRRKGVATYPAKGFVNQFNVVPTRLTDDAQSEVLDNALAKLAGGGK